jgi:hypothetical protein
MWISTCPTRVPPPVPVTIISSPACEFWQVGRVRGGDLIIHRAGKPTAVRCITAHVFLVDSTKLCLEGRWPGCCRSKKCCRYGKCCRGGKYWRARRGLKERERLNGRHRFVDLPKYRSSEKDQAQEESKFL